MEHRDGVFFLVNLHFYSGLSSMGIMLVCMGCAAVFEGAQVAAMIEVDVPNERIGLKNVNEGGGCTHELGRCTMGWHIVGLIAIPAT